MRYLGAILLLAAVVSAGFITDMIDGLRDTFGPVAQEIVRGVLFAGGGLLSVLWTQVSNVFADLLNLALRINAFANPLGNVDTYITPASAAGRRVRITGYHFPDFDSFLGIPYANPLTGRARFDHPTAFNYTEDVQAFTHGRACLQTLPLLDGATGQSEDCHFLNVVTPANSVGTDAKHPVMIWLFGGGFFGGAGSYYSTLAPLMVKKSQELGQPVIHVAMNYRLGIHGFGLGKEMAAEKLANNGIRDQRLAIEWVRENIAAFGGDPNKLTLYGESAGAISTSIHLLNPANKDVFKGAIMQSGHASTIPVPRTEDYQRPYDDFVELAGCSGQEDTLDCLRNLSEEEILSVTAQHSRLKQYELGVVSVIFRPSIDGDIIPDSPFKLQAEGKFANIPLITGTNKDEGTLFVNWLAHSEDDNRRLINNILPSPISDELFTKLFSVYTTDPSVGSPFNTGRNTFLLSPYYKQAAAIATDALFVSKARYYVAQANAHGNKNVWTYAFEAATPIIPPFLGCMHATELLFTYGIVSKWLPVGWTSKSERVSQAMMAYWIAFAHNQNPNTNGQPNWPAHTGPNDRQAQLFSDKGVYPIANTYRDNMMSMFQDPALYNAFFA